MVKKHEEETSTYPPYDLKLCLEQLVDMIGIEFKVCL
jgi:hypothetical protein